MDEHPPVEEPLELPVRALRPGMYLYSLGVQWAFHPFVRNQFTLDEESIAKIRQLGLEHVWIDPTRSTVAIPRASLSPRAAAATSGETESPDLRPAIGRGRDWARRLTQEARSAVKRMLDNAHAGRAIHLQDIDAVSGELCAALNDHPDAMLAFGRIRARDSYTYQHSVNVGVLLMAFAKHLGMPENHVRTLGTAGMVHDIGKTLIPDGLITKPGPLTADEYEVVKSHTTRGAELLRGINGIKPLIADIAEQHHERIDGSGYPHGRTGDELSIEARMASIVDVYDAVTAIRAYHDGRPPTEGLRIILGEAGRTFDTTLAQRFVRCIGVYPPGSLVRLTNDHLAVVLEPRANQIDRPLVRTIYDIRHARMLDTPRTLDLADPRARHRVVSYERPEDWAVPPELYVY